MPQVWLVESHRYAPQQSVERFAGSQSPPMPAHAGWQVALTQLPEQQSPFELQQSWSSWQLGSERAHAPPSLLPPPESSPAPLPLPLPLPASFLPPLPLPLPPSMPPPELAPVPVHFPAVHDSEQQSPYALQPCPVWLHAPAPHLDALQSLLQQSVLVAHALPSGLQEGAGAAHVPPGHAPPQQSLAALQLAPLAWQVADAHEPETQSLLQQSLLDEQPASRSAHMGCAQVPPLHWPLQQLLELWHDLPAPSQVAAPHWPALHVALQQSLASEQPWPVERHRSSAHTPATHDWLQQSV